MPRKKLAAEQIVKKLRQIGMMQGQGILSFEAPSAVLCRPIMRRNWIPHD